MPGPRSRCPLSFSSFGRSSRWPSCRPPTPRSRWMGIRRSSACSPRSGRPGRLPIRRRSFLWRKSSRSWKTPRMAARNLSRHSTAPLWRPTTRPAAGLEARTTAPARRPRTSALTRLGAHRGRRTHLRVSRRADPRPRPSFARCRCADPSCTHGRRSRLRMTRQEISTPSWHLRGLAALGVATLVATLSASVPGLADGLVIAALAGLLLGSVGGGFTRRAWRGQHP
jgi:hypothetical protein